MKENSPVYILADNLRVALMYAIPAIGRADLEFYGYAKDSVFLLTIKKVLLALDQGKELIIGG